MRGSKPGERRGGRKKGTLNKVTVEARAFCAGVVDDPKYQATVLRRALRGKLAPAVECMLWHYAKGKPTEHHEHTGKDGKPMEVRTVVFGGRYKPDQAPS